MDQDSPCSPGAGGSGPKTPITLEFIQQVLTKALSEIGYEAPQDVVKKLIARVTPVSSRVSSRATSPMKTNKNKNKRQASSSSDEGATCSDSTVVGSDSESENSNTSFTLVEGKNKRALRKALKKAKVARDQPEMDIDPSSAPTSRANDAKPSPTAVQQTQTTSTASVESTRNPVSASTQAVTAKTAPGTDCTRLRINYSKAVRTADDGIKIHCPDVETFRSLNKYLVDFKVHFTHEIQADLCGQGFPVHSVHRLCRRDGSPLWLVLAVLPRTEEAKNIFNNLNMVCGLSGIRVEAPHKKGGPGQCHRCQLYGHAAANCHADPRCVKCLVPHWTRECPRTPPPRDLNNFPDLAGNKPTPAAASRPVSNPWVNQSPRCHRGPPGTVWRSCPPRATRVAPASATAGTTSFGDDIQTVMSILRAVKSSEISEFARDFRACSNVEEKLMVLVRYHHLMVKLESI
ncbi:hypothetical protein EVAR_22637_1 [Eumeta japonica]|uniref:Pre-C2HC domain-containing protein n=1 Tax=Eumeta variegata TaxID=151549 RepID=A0A4C1VKV3_EUMVA|nr:hypothetical protein EVAR_22637_1 [Eumeta japonica]